MNRSLLLWASLALGCAGMAASAEEAPEPQRWAFAPKIDDFKEGALLDLRGLNEKVAGETGFIKKDEQGQFLLGNGTPVRFWAVGTSVLENRPWVKRPLWPDEPTQPSLAGHARFLAKHGVNLVRLHTFMNPDTKAQPLPKLEEGNLKTRDYIWEAVAAMKQEGIYTMLTPYWAAAFKLPESYGFGTDNAHGLLFFDPRLQAAYKTWLKELFVPPNPHTGIPLAKDPALAVIQIQNEDSTLFWTIANLAEQPRRMTEQQFYDWAVKLHGSPEAAQKAWGGSPRKRDDLAEHRFELLHIFSMTKDAPPSEARRLDDQLHFWAETMAHFHQDIVKYLRDELGCQQLVSAGNWHTAEAVRLDDALRWSYTFADVQSVNRYFPGVHQGDDKAGWALDNAQVYNSRSLLTNPYDWPLQLRLPHGQPFVITESSWTFPSRTAAEGPLLVAAYQSLTGFNAFCWFSCDTEQWTSPRSSNGYMQGTQQKFVIGYPDCLGQFPAAALMFRKGYVKQGAPVVSEARPLEDIWQRRKPALAEVDGYDARREPANAYTPRAKVDPKAFFVGPVEVRYGADSKETKVADLTPYIDEKAQIVKSNTGEHALNLGKKSFTLDTPCAQAVAAFFKGQNEFKLHDLSVRCGNDYGVVAAVSMDGKPLRESGKVLIQVGTNALPAGWKDEPATPEALAAAKFKPGTKIPEGLRKIDDVGHAPWMVERARCTITLANSHLEKAIVLDPNGYPRQTEALLRHGSMVTLALPEDALYVVLE